MKTVLIHAQDPELSTAWATYLSRDGSAVFTSADPLETAEILSMIKVDAVLISTNNPETFLLLGKVLKDKKDSANIVAVTGIQPSQLGLLLGNDSFTTLTSPFTFSSLSGVVNTSPNISEVVGNAFVLQNY